jgi:dTDP-4-amino-4,6-dideoxygalactose transaminase
LALEAALIALNIGPGADVLVTPRSFIASTTCVMQRGARPLFADVDRDSQNVTVSSLEAVRTPATAAVIVVHLAGWPCDMPAIMAWAGGHGIAVIEDAAQAHGAAINGQSVGSFGDIGVFSFCQDKIMSTGGDGGMLVTSDEAIWKRAWSAREHGKSWDAVHRSDHPSGFRWLVESVGSNWRMTGPQAAIGLRQLAKLDDWVERRGRNAAILRDRLATIESVRMPWPPDAPGPQGEFRHAAYRAYAFVEPSGIKADWSRDRIMQEINEAGWPCHVGGCAEIYRERVIIDAGLSPETPLRVAQELGETSLAFLVHPTIDEATMIAYADAVALTLSRACAATAQDRT